MTTTTGAFAAFVPDEQPPPPVGAISSDRLAIWGGKNTAFLFSGSNFYYDSYQTPVVPKSTSTWIEITQNRHAQLSRATPIVSLIVPNKATCLPDLYPLLLQENPTPSFRALRKAFANDPNVVFAESLLEASSPSRRHASSVWSGLDSHWSEFGALVTLNEVLVRFGLAPIEFKYAEQERIRVGGDLCHRWPPRVKTEWQVLRAETALPAPTDVYDNAAGKPYRNNGRHTVWTNTDAPIAKRLTIVGNSFSGPGHKSSNLTYWAARYFRRVTFVHSPNIPTDIHDFAETDLLLFQTVERFLPSAPTDRMAAADICTDSEGAS